VAGELTAAKGDGKETLRRSSGPTSSQRRRADEALANRPRRRRHRHRAAVHCEAAERQRHRGMPGGVDHPSSSAPPPPQAIEGVGDGELPRGDHRRRTRRRGPHKKKDEAKTWDEQSGQERDAAVDLAEAAEKKDAAVSPRRQPPPDGQSTACHEVSSSPVSVAWPALPGGVNSILAKEVRQPGVPLFA